MSGSFALSTIVPAEPAQVFDLSLDPSIHVQSMLRYGEELVAGPSDRLLRLDDVVTWRARHYGVPFTMTSRIVVCEPPAYFVDEQVSGPFESFRHEHRFDPVSQGTLMTDVVTLRAPLGPLGRIAERAFLLRRLQMLIELRNTHLVAVAHALPS